MLYSWSEGAGGPSRPGGVRSDRENKIFNFSERTDLLLSHQKSLTKFNLACPPVKSQSRHLIPSPLPSHSPLQFSVSTRPRPAFLCKERHERVVTHKSHLNRLCDTPLARFHSICYTPIYHLPMTQPDSHETGTSQAEGDGPDGSDKPPRPATIDPSRPPNGSHMNPQSPTSPTTNGTMKYQDVRSNIPLPAREAASHPKQPQIVACVLPKDAPGQLHSSPSTTSLSSDDHESWSPPSSRAPSRRSSRAPSFTAGRLSGLLSPKKQTPATPQPAGVEPPSTPRSKGPSSVHSDAAHKFTLKELLGTAPKLGRRSSVRSAGSSKKSESDGGAKSVAESTSTLLNKYGVCENAAIGKGATSVVRLVHKWDRAEEKIYAVKVSSL